jgi:hypothetical protein
MVNSNDGYLNQGARTQRRHALPEKAQRRRRGFSRSLSSGL